MARPFSFEALGLGQLAMGVGPDPRYPQCPPFSTGEVNHPPLEKEEV